MAAALLLLALCIVQPALGATTILVTSTADVLADDGYCTLREAVIVSNGDFALHSSPGECPAGSGADTIQLGPGTYTISIGGSFEESAYSGDLDLKDDVTISGAGMGLTVIDGGGSITGDYQLFYIFGNITVVAQSLTFTGFDGNDVFHTGVGGSTLYLIGTSFVDNDSGAVINAATLFVDDSLFQGNTAKYEGGAIYSSYAALEVGGSTFLNNRSGMDEDGGAIAAEGGSGSIVVRNSTFSGNKADRHGGALFLGQPGELNNITMYDNRADWDGDGTGDGGGIYMSDYPYTITIGNSILAMNVDMSPSSFLEHDCRGSFTSAGHNLISRDTAGCTGFTNGVNGDQVGTLASPIAPVLGALSDNGGLTATHALLPGSPAIDAGDDGTCESSDQRGVSRPQGAHCDIGAYEFQYPYSLYLPLITR